MPTETVATPLTDAAAKDYLGHSEVTANFARKLERDRALLREILAYLDGVLNGLIKRNAALPISSDLLSVLMTVRRALAATEDPK